MASSVVDINQILSLFISGSKPSVSQLVERTIGAWVHIYYAFLDMFHGLRPRDFEELIDGLLYMDIVAYQRKEISERARNG